MDFDCFVCMCNIHGFVSFMLMLFGLLYIVHHFMVMLDQNVANIFYCLDMVLLVLEILFPNFWLDLVFLSD